MLPYIAPYIPKYEAMSSKTLKMFSSRFLFALVTILSCLVTLAFGATTLVPDEVEALKEIANTLGKDWNFSVDPCSGQLGWITENPKEGFENSVNCTCSQNGTVCHVVSIVLKSQSLPGVLPPELVRLPQLQEIDLTRNYLNGTIPPVWGSMQLVHISLIGNRLTGPIPKEFGNITTLEKLTVEFNQLSGVLPPELGNLSRIEELHLTSNNFTGELPGELSRLSTLRDFRVGDNHFTGQIPNFIQNWTNLRKLVIQASGLDGPVPPGIALLEQLTDLRISDLSGTEEKFPPLDNITKLKYLILRSCNIIGPLPDYLWKMTDLKTLDLSFNKLSGEIPSSFVRLVSEVDVDFVYLTGNLLTGPVPNAMLKDYIDLSYNNFAVENSPGTLICPKQSVNLFGSSLEGNNSGIVSCLRRSHCSQNVYSLHINCGGDSYRDGSTTYEADTDTVAPSTFSERGTYWAISSTGNFIDDARSRDSYTWQSESRLSMNKAKLYMDARLSPLSLTYYGLCLLNGNYTVNLHFAEIMFTDDNKYSSLGRRIFDVYIQGKQVLKDFNIKDKAGGVGKAIVEPFTAVVTNNTLEIRFHWAGKGTTGIPVRGVYGPLISAISVDPDFPIPETLTPPAKGKASENSISAGTVVGIVVAVAFIIFLVLSILWWKGCLRRKDTMEQDLKGLDLQIGLFTLRQIKAATNNFDAANKIGEGGFGSVYKGLLADGTIVAVKQLSSKSKQGNREFLNEIGMISALQHPHLVKLYGCCIEGNQLLLVYEYMENNNLARALFGLKECQLKLDWPTRQKICVGIARGLAFLHEESTLKIVHRDIKATNVLLDKNFNPKISDFGLAKLDEEQNTHISTRIAGTYGYMAPEYAMRGYLTDKADVYSFGIVALEIVSGRINTSYSSKEDCFILLDWALALKEKGNLMELVDPRLGSDFNKEEVIVMINVALLCTNVSSVARPTMSSVVSMLDGRAVVQEYAFDPSVSNNEMKLKAMSNQYGLNQEENMNESLIQSMSIEGPCTGSSTSAADLYPISFGSEYWEKRN